MIKFIYRGIQIFEKNYSFSFDCTDLLLMMQ